MLKYTRFDRERRLCALMKLKLPKPRPLHLLYGLGIVVLLALSIYSASQIFLDLAAFQASEKEYEELRQTYYPAQGSPVGNPALRNPDYVGWILISDTEISFPVVQGPNNYRYLNATFGGGSNALGAIFMDYRCREVFDSPHVIIYGHNGRYGSMFSGLHRFLDRDYMNSHRYILISRADGTAETWQIWAAYKTDIYAPAYRMDFAKAEDFAVFAGSLGAPPGSARLLTLSTCTSGGNDNERFLVHAFFVQ
jgi:sortase B